MRSVLSILSASAIVLSLGNCVVYAGGGGGAGAGASGEFVWSWGSSTEVDYGGGVAMSEDGTGSTQSKVLELSLTIDPGDGSVDEANLTEQVWLTQSWSSETVQTNAMDAKTINYDQSNRYTPIFAQLREDKLVEARFAVNLQFGWNMVQVAGKFVGYDSKGNPSEVEVEEEPDYIFVDFGAPIPLKVLLDWDQTGADLDLIVHEEDAGLESDQWIYWDNMGYEKAKCLSSDVQVECYRLEGYTTGEGRKNGFSFGSLDKDDVSRGGPETFTLDPSGEDNVALLPAGGYQDGDQFHVYVNYYEGAVPTNSVVSVYLNGSQTPSACLQMKGMEEAKADPPGPDALAEGLLVRVGTLSFNGATGYTWDDSKIGRAHV